MSLRLIQYSDVENACDDPDRIGRLARTIRRYRDDGTVVVGTGDNTSPGVLPLVTEGRQAIRFYEAVDPDVETFGNHDFDYGPGATLKVVRDSPQTWVSANVRRDGDRFGADAGVEPWTVVERDGVRVGFTGVTTPRTASLNPMATDLTFADPVAAAREATARLREAGADHVVVCSHLGTGDDDLARAVDADVVLGGHVPSPRVERVDGTLLTRPGDGGAAVVEVRLDEGPTARLRPTSAVDPATDVVAEFERLRAEAGLDEVVGRVDDPIARTEEALFGGECRAGNFVADAYRWKTGADLALQNSGGVRSGPALSGEVTAADVIGLVPFDEPVAVAEVPGERLARVLAGGAGVDLGFAEPDWWHAQVSGATVEWDPDGHAVRPLTVGGEPFDPDATYRLATSDYLFHTDDEFPALRPADRVDRTAGTQYDVLLEYAREVGIEARVEGRVRRVD
ncbi:bifunctional metallophosphatase/5'-nucleotidase [Salinilacihabitans rarus]|uniref:bifunctional metallophosphatase/5'-nucleotidase n=1 Tax=Salinilacihabitans rarus TaxID=2961596 RepID=UPI0020C84521|nr:5'-nucleotidase C-terminal domain-containing protein [Salinilacihabitans rarus]